MTKIMIPNQIVRTVKVNRERKPKKVLDATGCRQHVNNDVVKTMPHGEGETVEVVFFQVGRFINDPGLEKEYELRGLKAVDPYSLFTANEADPTFADGHPNATHWKDKKGKWCYAAFHRWNDAKRYVDVDRLDHVWSDRRWFAGVRK